MRSSVSRQIGRFGNEASRRLYRGAVEAAKKLEQRLDLSTNLAELFSSETTDLRMRLKEYCERLIFTDPVEYGKKAEDLLWRKVFYDFFNRCKQNRKKLLDSEYYRSSLISHLLAGIGFYHHMLLRIQTEFHINLEGKVDAPFLWHLKGVKKERWKKYQQSAASDGNVRTWANQACHRILIYLGDLERYIAELHELESTHLAERYYQQAFCLNCQNGTPHNQLGSLYNNRFDSAYHYMRCLACQEKFDGAEGNLIRVFEKNEEILKQMSSSQNISNDSSDCSKFLSRFLKLCHMFYISSGENSEIYCQDILREFDIMLNCSPEKDISAEELPAQLSDNMVFKIVVMSLICVAKCQENGNRDASVATAFCLALFSYIVHRAAKCLFSSIYEQRLEMKPKNTGNENISVKHETPANKEQLSDTSGESEISKDFSAKKLGNKKIGIKKISSRHLRTLRRRRKMSSTSQEDSELSEGDITELPESDEESALLNSDVSQTGSCSSESASENEDDLLEEQNKLNNEGKPKKDRNLDKNFIHSNGLAKNEGDLKSKEASILNETESLVSSQVDSFEEIQISVEKVILALKKNGLLQCLKVLSDWLRINEDILSACAESSQFLISRLIELLNLLLKIEEYLVSSKECLIRLQQNGASWKQVYPLPEDIALQGLPLIKEIHSRLSFDVAKKRELSSSSQVFLRIQCLLSFGRCLTRASESSVDFDVEKKKYYFNLCNKTRESNKDVTNNQESIRHNIESQRQQLMRSMAHLWLKAEVNDLENLVEGGSAPQLSPYLVCDTSLLCYNLSALRQLIMSKRFIVVVPLVVIANLDQLKKESIQAREAIRWLESELRKGCRYIRAQRQMEKISLVPMKYPKKKEKEAWDFFEILECCNYLVQQQTNGKADCPLVTLLVGSQHQLPENASAIAQSIDVIIENLKGFLLKWRSYSKNPG
ncbi:nonsense-mediated mRNA decay factor SMG5-like [Uloborus diversus]|uniref:nonsense-mediated mRNA decay factor SMG5-like n=1 Tax=Uloborus diversus TaxID=327109 RepID=UPI0024098937|nr:nonsense-mediated mRNA decay factor SMG5-like [Uloborus diversus]